MKYVNLTHNILNVLIAVAGGVTGYLLLSGCVEVGDALDCSASTLDPVWTSAIVPALATAKLALNYIRDGVNGFFAEQPKIVKGE